MFGQSVANRAAQTDYENQHLQWRQDHEAKLKSADGWLALVGLFWLKEGDNHFGSDTANVVILPAASSPKHAGIFRLQKGRVSLFVDEGSPVTVNGKSAKSAEINIDNAVTATNSPDKIILNNVTLQLIKRGQKFGIRPRDKNSKAIKEFVGERWFPVNQEYCVTAQFTHYNPRKKIKIVNIHGETEDSEVLGYVTFSLQGKEYRLDAEIDDEETLLFNFKDLTNKNQTYQPGRFLFTNWPKDGKLTLDFNKAENPPCVFSEFTVCPLAPRQNHLAVAIEAGELRYQKNGQ